MRRLFAPAAGLRRSVGYALIGLVCFLFGFALSFKFMLQPAIGWLGRAWNGVLVRYVPAESVDATNHLIGGALLLLGFYLLFHGLRGLVRRLVETLTPGMGDKMVNVYVRRAQLAQGPRIVALGGGTGLSTLLRGLKQHSSNITAIVTVTDDGGSSGRLVQELGIIPPGDLRNCLVALADAEKLMTDLFQYRFKQTSGSLSGHSIGNLLIAALVDQAGGNMEEALQRASEVLAIRGRVIPSTMQMVRLRALMENGLEICGETAIADSRLRVRRVFLDPADSPPQEEALQAIGEADLICVGPGSVYTSVIPNLLVPGIAEAIRDADAKKAYICNVMTQPGESDAFTAAEHVVAIQANVEARVFDYVVLNTGAPSASAIEKYRDSNQFLVEADADRIRTMGFRVVTGNFMSETDVVRHDPVRVAAKLVELVGR
jgi:uncharacterized cofD-like protein